MQERGITRLEVSVYGNQQDITKRAGSEIIQNVLKMVSPVDTPLFVIQEARKQWENLAEKITKCFTLVDRPNRIIYMVWYANTTTKRLAGIQADYSKKKNLEDIEDYVKWFISDFGFKMVPIFRADILDIEAQKIIMSPLQCYIKNKDSYTILAPCNRPITVFKNPPTISNYLPSTPIVSWQWREKKERTPNDRKPKQELIESPEIATKRQVSMLGVRQREEILRELQEARFKVEWLDRSKDVLKSLSLSPPYRTAEDIQNIKIKMEKIEKTKKLEKETFNWIVERLKGWNTENIKYTPVGKYKILGWTNSKYSPMVVLQNCDGDIRNIWANTKLQKILKVISPYFVCKKVKYQNIFYFVPTGEEENLYFNINIEAEKSFYSNGKEINFMPITIDSPGYTELSRQLEEIERETSEIIEQHSGIFLENVKAPDAKHLQTCRNIEDGSYKILRFSKTMFRGTTKTYLHLVAIVEGVLERKEIVVNGYYIEEEIKKIEQQEELTNIKHPVICRLGMLKTNPNKRKFRTCTITYNP